MKGEKRHTHTHTHNLRTVLQQGVTRDDVRFNSLIQTRCSREPNLHHVLSSTNRREFRLADLMIEQLCWEAEAQRVLHVKRDLPYVERAKRDLLCSKRDLL